MFWSNPRLFLNWSARLKMTSGAKLSIFCRSKSRLSKMARCSVGWPRVPRAARTFASVFQSSVFISLLRSWSILVGRMASNRARTFSFFFTLFGALKLAGKKVIHHQRSYISGNAKLLLWIVVIRTKAEVIATFDQPRKKLIHTVLLLVSPLADCIEQTATPRPQIRTRFYPGRRGEKLSQIGVVKPRISVFVNLSFTRVIRLELEVQTILFLHPI